MANDPRLLQQMMNMKVRLNELPQQLLDTIMTFLDAKDLAQMRGVFKKSASRLEDVKFLNLSTYSEKITDVVLGDFMHACPNLTDLNVMSCHNLTSRGFKGCRHAGEIDHAQCILSPANTCLSRYSCPNGELKSSLYG